MHRSLTRFLGLAVFGALVFQASTAEATLELRVSRGGFSAVIMDDGMMGDLVAGDGIIDPIDMATRFGAAWTTAGTGAPLDLLVSADASQQWDGNPRSMQSDGGRIITSADYSRGAGAGADTVIVDTAADFETMPVIGQPANYFQTDIFHEVLTTGGTGLSPSVVSATSYFSTGPNDGFFDFAGYQFSQTVAASLPLDGSPGTYGARTIAAPGALPPAGSLFPGTMGSELQVAQSFELLLAAGDSGTVTMQTLVNPEPVSLVLSTLGLGAVGFRLRRRSRQVNDSVA